MGMALRGAEKEDGSYVAGGARSCAVESGEPEAQAGGELSMVCESSSSRMVLPCCCFVASMSAALSVKAVAEEGRWMGLLSENDDERTERTERRAGRDGNESTAAELVARWTDSQHRRVKRCARERERLLKRTSSRQGGFSYNAVLRVESSRQLSLARLRLPVVQEKPKPKGFCRG